MANPEKYEMWICDRDFQSILRMIFNTLCWGFSKHCDEDYINIVMMIFKILWWGFPKHFEETLFGLSEDRCSGLSGSEAARHHQSSPQLFLSINKIIMIIFFFFLSINKIMIDINHYIDDHHRGLSKYYKPILTSTLSWHQ